MSIDPSAALGFGLKNPVFVVAATVLALVVLAAVWLTARGVTRSIKRALKDKHPEDILTFVVAGLCTAISAQGMFKFFSDKLSMPWWMQGLGFCVFEVAQVTFALRARRQIKADEPGGAGINGVLVWIMAALSAILSATDASGWGAIARMIFPFLAAITWELGLAIERRRTGKRTIQWRLDLERIAVRLGLAESAHRSVGEVDTHRRLNVAAVATYRMDLLRTSRWAWRSARARRRQNSAMQDLMATTDFATNAAMQDELRTMIAILKGAATLADLSDAPPWARPDRVTAVFDAARIHFAPLISGAVDTGTQNRGELDAGTGTDTAPEPPADTGTEMPSETGTDTGTDTGSEGEPDTGTDTDPPKPKRTGTRRRRNSRRGTGTKTGPKPRTDEENALLLERARELNAEHFREHGKAISGDKLAGALRVSKTTALGLLRDVKRLREVRPTDGVA